MKALLLALVMIVTGAAQAQAVEFYECEGLAGVDEYRAGVNLTTNSAGFFDNDSTSELKLTQVRILESSPPQWQYTFEGDDPSYAGSQRLVFNKTRLTATMFAIEADGSTEEIGQAACKASTEVWN